MERWDECESFVLDPFPLQSNPSTKPWNKPDTQNYYATDPVRQAGNRGGGPGTARQTAPRNSRSRTGRISRAGGVIEPTDGEWRDDHGEPQPQPPFVSNVFVRDMTKTRNAHLARTPKMKVITKVPGDPSVIKKAPTVKPRKVNPLRPQSCTPGSMDATDLMALEEDINEAEQQEDAKRLAILMSGDLKDQVNIVKKSDRPRKYTASTTIHRLFTE